MMHTRASMLNLGGIMAYPKVLYPRTLDSGHEIVPACY